MHYKNYLRIKTKPTHEMKSVADSIIKQCKINGSWNGSSEN